MLIEALAAWSVLGHEDSGHRLGRLLQRWRGLLAGDWNRDSNFELVRSLLEIQPTLSAESFITKVLDAGLAQAIRRLAAGEDQIAIQQMLRAFTAHPLSGQSVVQLAGRARNVGSIEMTTMSSSKGREFDIVIVLGADEGRMPHYLSRNNEQLIREDRRKFYVSLTRARFECHFFYSGYTETPWGRINRNGPSRFLAEIGLH